MYKIINGDSFIELKELTENSVDSVVCDPPYLLNFMGKEFDREKGNPADDVEFWKLVLKTMKPGAHLLAAGIGRTHHRVMVAIEDAGFEIRDCIYHVFGCLSEDTEILTKDGWKLYHKDILSDSVLCYNIDNDTYEYNQPTKKYWYRNEHTAYSIKSDTTDQIVSRNHRVIVERNGRKEFAYAETLERQEGVPVLESLSSLPDTTYDAHQRTSTPKQDLLSDLQRNENINNQDRKEVKTTSELQTVQDKILSEIVSNIESNILLTQLSGKIKRLSPFTVLLKRKGEEKTRKGVIGVRQSSMEGWSYLSQPKRQIRRAIDKICQMSKGLFSYGEDRRLCNGTPTICSYSDATPTYESRERTSHQSRRNGQQNRELNAIQNQRGTQEIRVGSSHNTTLATVTPIKYNGHVWCVEVPTGAFVARRNGKIFITGNSGFPKSHNIEKTLIKMGENEKAKEFAGFGTALKPAVEIWTLARKPLSESTIAENVLKWGTGGINIDGCRVGTEIMNNAPAGNKEGGNSLNMSKTGMPQDVEGTTSQGRFPANFIHDGSDEVVGLFPDTGKGNGGKPYNYAGKEYDNSETSMFNGDKPQAPSDFNDSGSASRYFKSCPYEEGEGASFAYFPKASKKDRNEGLDSTLTVKYNGSICKEENTVAVQLLQRVISEQELVSFSTGESGENIMVQCQSDSLSTILTETNRIIELKIYNSLMLSLTNESTQGANSETEAGGNLAESVADLRRWLLTTTKGNQELALGASRVVLETLSLISVKENWKNLGNFHSTVKPTSLMQYLVRLVTPKGGTVLDPFAGSFSTGKACVLEGFDFIGIELDKEYCAIGEARMAKAKRFFTV